MTLISLAERDYLRTRVDKMEAACIQFTSAFESKDKENASLKEEIRVLKRERTQERETIYKPADFIHQYVALHFQENSLLPP